MAGFQATATIKAPCVIVLCETCFIPWSGLGDGATVFQPVKVASSQSISSPHAFS